jgi:hypothetical protein
MRCPHVCMMRGRYADEVGVDVLSDLATPGTDVGVLVTLAPGDGAVRRETSGGEVRSRPHMPS